MIIYGCLLLTSGRVLLIKCKTNTMLNLKEGHPYKEFGVYHKPQIFKTANIKTAKFKGWLYLKLLAKTKNGFKNSNNTYI